jgi:hypothetical protein
MRVAGGDPPTTAPRGKMKILSAHPPKPRNAPHPARVNIVFVVKVIALAMMVLYGAASHFLF